MIIILGRLLQVKAFLESTFLFCFTAVAYVGRFAQHWTNVFNKIRAFLIAHSACGAVLSMLAINSEPAADERALAIEAVNAFIWRPEFSRFATGDRVLFHLPGNS